MNTEWLRKARSGVRLRQRRLQMTIPSVLAEGERFEMKVTAFDADSLPAEDWEPEIVFQGSVGVEGLPPSARYSRAADGRLTVGPLRATGPEMARVRGRIEGRPCESNPAWVFANPSWRLYWGDLHVHTVYSNCSAWSCQDPEFGYLYARDVSCLDFAAAADHLRGIASSPERWPRLQALARQYTEPGRFVAFLAFESSHKTGFGGDINAYFLDDDAPYFWVDRDDMKGTGPAVTLEQLWEVLDRNGKRYFTVPHHTARAGKYRSFADRSYNAVREPLFEIYSAWGSSEKHPSRMPLYGGNATEPAHFVDALRAGCRYGVIASSDDHTTLPGGESRNWGRAHGPQALSGYHHMGLAAVRAPALSREALFEGMMRRRTYGTTFDRSLVDLRLGDLGMGECLTVDAGDPLNRKRDVTVRCSLEDGAGALVTLSRNGQDFASQTIPLHDDAVGQVVFRDEERLDGIAVRDARFHPEPFVVYYARVENRRGDALWTSPIWLDL